VMAMPCHRETRHGGSSGDEEWWSKRWGENKTVRSEGDIKIAKVFHRFLPAILPLLHSEGCLGLNELFFIKAIFLFRKYYNPTR